MKGNLYIVSTPIGNLSDISYRAVEILNFVDIVLAEDTRHTKILLSHYQIENKIESFHEHNENSSLKGIHKLLEQGLNIALVSDAGTPLINDPGFKLVSLAKENNIPVIPIPGPSSPIVALSVSGMPTDRFSFMGFVPTKNSERAAFLKRADLIGGSVIFFESPKRVLKTVESIYELFGPNRQLCIAKELTKSFETVITSSVERIIEFLNESPEHQKGEFVIILEGIKEPSTDEKMQLLQTILPHIIKEMPPSKAAKLAAKITKLNKEVCYEAIKEL